MSQQEVFDGSTSFIGGQNAGIEPNLINPTQYAAGINVSVKRGNLFPRPGFEHIYPIKVMTEGGISLPNGAVRSYQDIFDYGKFQGASPHAMETVTEIVAVISGLIFCIHPKKGMAFVIPVTEVDGKQSRLGQYNDKHNISEAGRYYVICDWPDYPVILDGHMARRADPSKYEVPLPAVLTTYNQNRLFAFSNVNEFTAGDPVGNPLTPEAPITFEEVFAPAAPFIGQIFSLGSESLFDGITAAGFFPRIDGNTDLGPAFVANKHSLYTFQTQLERTAWGQTNFGSLALNRVGIAGQDAVTKVQQDIWFHDGEGHIRSFSMARSDQQSWARSPLDKEVENWIRYCDPSLISYSLAEYHNNRILFSANPFIATSLDLFGNPVEDIAFRGMIALELDPVSGFGQQPNPSWAGLWLGVNPMAFINVENDLYIFSKDEGSRNSIYRIQPDKLSWDSWRNKRKQIVSRIETRQYGFDSQGLEYALKLEVAAFPGMKDIGGEFYFGLERRNDNFPNYSNWRTFKYSAKVEQTNVKSNKMNSLVPHTFREMNFGSPVDYNDDKCNPVTGEQMHAFDVTQFRMTLSALSWRMTEFRLKAQLADDGQRITHDVCKPNENVEVIDDGGDIVNFNLYSIAPKEGTWEWPKL